MTERLPEYPCTCLPAPLDIPICDGCQRNVTARLVRGTAFYSSDVEWAVGYFARDGRSGGEIENIITAFARVPHPGEWGLVDFVEAVEALKARA